MSYCRWSSDKMQSDVYAYEDFMGGYTIHVRGVHPVNPEIIPDMPIEAFKNSDTEAVERWSIENREAHKKLVYESNNLKFDDQTLVAFTLEGLKGTLEGLRNVGYYVPESAFEMIDRSSADTDLEELDEIV